MESDDRPVRVLSALDEDPVPIMGGKVGWVPLRCLGRDDLALEELNRAQEINPEIRDRALEDEHPAPLMKDL